MAGEDLTGGEYGVCWNFGGGGSFLTGEGEGTGSVCALSIGGGGGCSDEFLTGVNIIDSSSPSSSSSSAAVYECFSFEGDDRGDACTREVLGGVLAL